MKIFTPLSLLLFWMLLTLQSTAQKRTYSYVAAINKIHHIDTATFHSSLCPIWQDSTILQEYSTGNARVNYSSAAAAINPKAAVFNHSFYAGQMEITPSDTFYIDSIYLTGAYMTPNNMGATPGDQLEISVVLESDTNLYTWSSPAVGSPYLINAVPTTANTSIRAVAPYSDPAMRIAGDPTKVRYTWTYNLTNADTSRYSSGTYQLKKFALAPPSPIMALPGDIAIVSFTFKTSTPWTSTDILSFSPGTTSRNHFRAHFLEENQFDYLSYRNHTENAGGDFCNSSLMFSYDPSAYYSSIQIESLNSKNYQYEDLDVEWVISSPGAGVVPPIIGNVWELKKPFIGLNIHPNPSTNQFTFSFSKPLTSPVQCNIYSLMGKKVQATQFVSGGQEFRIYLNELTSGTYICELQNDEYQERTHLIKF